MYHNWPEIRQRSGPAKSCWHLDFNLESEDESYTSDNIASIQREAIYCFSYDTTFLLLVLFEHISTGILVEHWFIKNVPREDFHFILLILPSTCLKT